MCFIMRNVPNNFLYKLDLILKWNFGYITTLEFFFRLICLEKKKRRFAFFQFTHAINWNVFPFFPPLNNRKTYENENCTSMIFESSRY